MQYLKQSFTIKNIEVSSLNSPRPNSEWYRVSEKNYGKHIETNQKKRILWK